MGKGKGHIPIRTCITCGAKREKNGLVRLVRDKEGQFVIDELQKRKGRGAYICKTKSCWEQLPRNKFLTQPG